MSSGISPAFIHLRLHTEFSLQDSVVRIPELVERAAQLGMPAVGVTDQNNLFAMVKFYREALKRGVKPIIGVDVLLRMRGERARAGALTLLCKDPGGYQNVANSSRAPGSRARTRRAADRSQLAG
jgi:DNA polymerase-3 subunit alpha